MNEKRGEGWRGNVSHTQEQDTTMRPSRTINQRPEIMILCNENALVTDSPRQDICVDHM
jgi:hypothetical protein